MAYIEYVKVGTAADFRKSINDGLNSVVNAAKQCEIMFDEMKEVKESVEARLDELDDIFEGLEEETRDRLDDIEEKLNERLDNLENEVENIVQNVFVRDMQALVDEAFKTEIEELMQDGYAGALYKNMMANVVVSSDIPGPINEKYPLEKPVLWFEILPDEDI